MENQVIQIGLEFIFGPIQKYEKDANGKEITGIQVIDNDEITKKLDEEIGDLWCSLWSKDDNSSSGLLFDEKREKELAPRLLEMLHELINRLNEINDGSYEIQDMITKHLKTLID